MVPLTPGTAAPSPSDGVRMSESSSGGGVIAALGIIGCLGLMLCTGLLGAGSYWLMRTTPVPAPVVDDVSAEPLE